MNSINIQADLKSFCAQVSNTDTTKDRRTIGTHNKNSRTNE